MKKFQLTCLMVMITSLSYSQQSIQRWNFLEKNNNQEKRILIVDSIINNCFWSREMNCIPWNLLRKNDFSEKSKQKLVDFFNRSLDQNEIEQIKTDCKFYLQKNIDNYKEKAKLQNLPFEEYYKTIVDKEVNRSIYRKSKLARSEISSLYPRLLGWLDYKQAIPLLESILKDSIQDKNYASNDRTEFVLNCKLALARMGNKKYENEIIRQYKDIDTDPTKSEFLAPLNNLFYMNTRKSINYVIEMSNTNKSHKPEFYEYGLPEQQPVYQKNVILIYLTTVITNYPIKMGKDDLYFILSPNFSGDVISSYSNLSVYVKQMDGLKMWLKNNKSSYQINRDRFFYNK